MSDPSTAIGAPKFAKAISKIKNVLINLDMSTTHRDRNWEHLLKLSFAVKAVVLALQRSTSFETLKLTCSSHNHSGNIVIQMLSPLSILRGVTIEDIAVRGPAPNHKITHLPHNFSDENAPTTIPDHQWSQRFHQWVRIHIAPTDKMWWVRTINPATGRPLSTGVSYESILTKAWLGWQTQNLQMIGVVKKYVYDEIKGVQNERIAESAVPPFKAYWIESLLRGNTIYRATHLTLNPVQDQLRPYLSHGAYEYFDDIWQEGFLDGRFHGVGSWQTLVCPPVVRGSDPASRKDVIFYDASIQHGRPNTAKYYLKNGTRFHGALREFLREQQSQRQHVEISTIVVSMPEQPEPLFSTQPPEEAGADLTSGEFADTHGGEPGEARPVLTEPDLTNIKCDLYRINRSGDNYEGSTEPITYEDVDITHRHYEQLYAAARSSVSVNELFDTRDCQRKVDRSRRSYNTLGASGVRLQTSPLFPLLPPAQSIHPDTASMSSNYNLQEPAARSGIHLLLSARRPASLPEGYRRRVIHSRVRIVGPRGVVRFQSPVRENPIPDDPDPTRRHSISEPSRWTHPSQPTRNVFDRPMRQSSRQVAPPITFAGYEASRGGSTGIFNLASPPDGSNERQTSNSCRRRRRSQVDTSNLRPMRSPTRGTKTILKRHSRETENIRYAMESMNDRQRHHIIIELRRYLHLCAGGPPLDPSLQLENLMDQLSFFEENLRVLTSEEQDLADIVLAFWRAGLEASEPRPRFEVSIVPTRVGTTITADDIMPTMLVSGDRSRDSPQELLDELARYAANLRRLSLGLGLGQGTKLVMMGQDNGYETGQSGELASFTASLRQQFGSSEDASTSLSEEAKMDEGEFLEEEEDDFAEDDFDEDDFDWDEVHGGADEDGEMRLYDSDGNSLPELP